WQQTFANFGGVSTASQARQEYTIWQQYSTSVGTWDARGLGLGGWTLGIQHFYDPGSKVLYNGDGTRRSVGALANGTINTSAGTGVGGFSGDNGPATNAQLFGPLGVVAEAGGSYDIADTNNNRVRRVDTQGIIHTMAGGGCCSLGDGGPAILAMLNLPNAVALGPDQTLYIAETANARARHV